LIVAIDLVTSRSAAAAALCDCSCGCLCWLSLTFHLPIAAALIHRSLITKLAFDLFPMATMDNLANTITQIL